MIVHVLAITVSIAQYYAIMSTLFALPTSYLYNDTAITGNGNQILNRVDYVRLHTQFDLLLVVDECKYRGCPTKEIPSSLCLLFRSLHT